MKNKGKIITFTIIILVSIGGLLFKGYLSDETYVLNQEEDINNNQVETLNQDDSLEDNNEENKESKKNESEKNISTKKITVYVSGQVEKEGIVTLDSDKRLADAVEKLGGLTKKADTNNINLAMKLEDETHYIIPKKGQSIQENSGLSEVSSNLNDSSKSNNTNGNNQSDSQTSKININTADVNQLDNIPGVGPATANKILSYRNENGNFKNIEDMKNVNGIGDKKFENMKEFICVK